MNVQLTHVRKQICPVLQEPFKECYCTSMSSQDIEKTVFFCSRKYKTCEIYKLNYPISRDIF